MDNSVKIKAILKQQLELAQIQRLVHVFVLMVILEHFARHRTSVQQVPKDNHVRMMQHQLDYILLVVAHVWMDTLETIVKLDVLMDLEDNLAKMEEQLVEHQQVVLVYVQMATLAATVKLFLLAQKEQMVKLVKTMVWLSKMHKKLVVSVIAQ